MTHDEKICRSKKAWSTRVKAEVHALGVMNHPVPAYRSTVPIYVYHCRTCGLYHLTRISPAQWAARFSTLSPASAGTGLRRTPDPDKHESSPGHG